MTSADARTLLTRPAIELAALIRTGEISARELVELALRRADERRDLNAFTFLWPEEALAEAEQIGPEDSRPFAGVPMAIKELSAVQGKPCTRSSVFLKHEIAPGDDYAVRRLRDAGFIFIGRTNSPEFGIVPVTEPRLFGPARNPWNTDRTPGGSSGGAAAAVAGGILPAAHASDGGGSIRIPAACCGLVGLKPGRGRISWGPFVGDSFLSTQGVVTRSVADSAAILDVMAGYEVGDSTWAPPPAEPFARTAARQPEKLRIAFTTASPVDTPLDPTCAAPVRETAELLASLGHEVEEVTPSDFQDAEKLPLFGRIWAVQIAASVSAAVAVAGRDPGPDDLEPLTWDMYREGSAATAMEYMEVLGALKLTARRLIESFSAYDILITPMTAQPPLRVGELNTCGADPAAEWRKASAFVPYTATWNVTGQPAISLPVANGLDGLPRAVQLVGPPTREAVLLSLSAQIEAARPWAARFAPGISPAAAAARTQ
jgi:amidase